MAPTANTVNTSAVRSDSSTSAVREEADRQELGSPSTRIAPRWNSATHKTRPMPRTTAYSWADEKLAERPIKPTDIQRRIARRVDPSMVPGRKARELLDQAIERIQSRQDRNNSEQLT